MKDSLLDFRDPGKLYQKFPGESIVEQKNLLKTRKVLFFIDACRDDPRQGKGKRIILFGSVSRKEATKKSDVDLFIEVSAKARETEEAVDRIMDKFYVSPKFTRYWKLLGIDNPISCKLGTPSEWKDLHPSLIQDGIVLYGKYGREAVEGKPSLLISCENIKPESKRVMVNRKLFGYVKNGKTYEGYVSRYGATRVSKGALLVPLENRQIFEALFHRYRIPLEIHSFIEVD